MPEVAGDAARILLVEDDENDAELALRALAKGGLSDQVHRVRDGEQALAYLFAREAGARDPSALRVVLLDLKLPRLDGLAVLARIRSDPRTKTLPVVILTSSMLPADVAACYRAGANSFVVKQVEFERHSRTLREVAEYWLHLNVTAGA